MGIRRPKSLDEYPRFEADVGVRCRKCGRVAVYEAAEICAYFRAKRIRRTLPIETKPFRCLGCGARNIEAFPIHRSGRPDPLPARPPIPRPIYTFYYWGGEPDFNLKVP